MFELSPRRTGREGQRGQMIVVAALAAVVIFAGMSMAIDLSGDTHIHRTDQNASDSGALAGARDLTTVVTAAEQSSAVTDALVAVGLAEGWETSPSVVWWSGSPSSGTTVTFQGHNVTVTTPSVDAPTGTLCGGSNPNCVEVVITQTQNNSFGSFVGAPTTAVGSRSIAYHFGPSSPFGYALWATTEVDSGNQVEKVYGDTYVGNGYQPQSSGKAGLCVYEVAGPETTATDTDGDSGGASDDDQDDQGHIVYGVVPPTVGPDPSYGAPPPAYCADSTKGKGDVWAQQGPTIADHASSTCASGTVPTQNGSDYLCLLSSASVPSIVLPQTNQPQLCAGGTGKVDSSTAAGVYPVAAGCAVTLDFSGAANNGNISCVDLVLGTGASVSVNDKKSNQYMTSYGYSPATDSVANSAISALGWPVPAAACAGASTENPTNSYNCVICANPATGNPTGLSNGSTGCCSDTLFVGSVFLPGQTISFRTNQAMEDVGQVYCYDWAVQSGNHPNPAVSYDSNDVAQQPEVLRLEE